jgi:site-specific recombinase XerD
MSNPINNELIAEFIAYKVEYMQVSANTFIHYNKWLRQFADFAESMSHNLLTVNQQVIMDYKRSLKDMRPDTIRTYLAAVSTFYSWASHPTVKKVASNPCPPMKMEKSPSHPNVIPTATEFFKMRLKIGRLREATAFEMFATSGMRISELAQLRAADINYGCRVADYELNTISPYIGGWIELNPSKGLLIKRGHYRTVFFSRLAAKLLRLHIASMGIPDDSMLPIFPYKTERIYDWIRRAGEGIIGAKESDKIKYQRRAGFLDVDVSKLEGTDAYKDLVRKAQEAERKKREEHKGIEEVSTPIASRPTILHPHSMRHFFAVCQYYRNYYGNRHDLVTLRDLLGHSNTMQTNVYVTSQPVCTNDHEWKRIYCGNGFDYRRAISNGNSNA